MVSARLSIRQNGPKSCFQGSDASDLGTTGITYPIRPTVSDSSLFDGDNNAEFRWRQRRLEGKWRDVPCFKNVVLPELPRRYRQSALAWKSGKQGNAESTVSIGDVSMP